MQNDILVIFTGGTIGTAPPVNGVKRQETQTKPLEKRNYTDYFLINRYLQNNRQFTKERNIQFHTKQPLETDSSFMTIAKWNTLINELKKIDFSKYAGVIITHGTDTIAFTAPLISIILSHLDIPVIFVSSNEHLRSPLANGHKNFEDAVHFICTQSSNDPALRKICGTYVAYSYDLKQTIFYIATEMKQSEAFINRYESRTGVDFGYVENGQFYVNNIDNANKLHKDSSIDIETFLTKHGYEGQSIIDLIGELENKVALIQPYIGLDYSAIQIPEHIKAILHTTYHSFTFSLEESENGIYSAKTLTDNQDHADLYFTSYYYNEYASQEEIAGIKRASFILGSTLEFAYAKLLVGYNLFEHDKAKLADFLNLAFNEVIHGM